MNKDTYQASKHSQTHSLAHKVLFRVVAYWYKHNTAQSKYWGKKKDILKERSRIQMVCLGWMDGSIDRVVFNQKGGGASFHQPLRLVPLPLSSHDAHGRHIHQLQLQPLLQSPLLSCACGHALDLSLPYASRAEIYHYQEKEEKTLAFLLKITIYKLIYIYIYTHTTKVRYYQGISTSCDSTHLAKVLEILVVLLFLPVVNLRLGGDGGGTISYCVRLTVPSLSITSTGSLSVDSFNRLFLVLVVMEKVVVVMLLFSHGIGV